jgi:hypothetical protein
MALARTYSMALAGVRGHVVEVEADIENGLVALLLVGLPDTALREARDRIRSAIINSRHTWPQRRITVGLSPASLPKRGSGFDVSIAGLRHSETPHTHSPALPLCGELHRGLPLLPAAAMGRQRGLAPGATERRSAARRRAPGRVGGTRCAVQSRPSGRARDRQGSSPRPSRSGFLPRIAVGGNERPVSDRTFTRRVGKWDIC